MLILAGLAAVTVLTVFTGFFVAQEFAYVAVDRGKLRHRADQGDKPSIKALEITSKLSFILSGAQFGITVTALLVGYVSEPLLGQGLAQIIGLTDAPAALTTSLSVALALGISTVIQMVLGELGPKNWAITEPERLARALWRPTVIYLKVFGPIIALCDKASNALLRSVGIEPVEELPHGATAEDLQRIIEASQTGGLVDEDLARLLDRGLAFRTHTAEQVMTPRIDVESVQADEPASRVIELLGTGHSRFPVTGRDIDDVIGVVGINEILDVPPEDRDTTPVRTLITEPLRVPESLPLPRVLDALREQHRQMAVVVDEHGGFAGVITFEDVAEEVVGEIWDEDEEVEEHGERDAAGAYVLPARLRLDEAGALMGLELPEDDDYETLGGLVLDRLERTAVEGDVVDLRWSTRDDNGDEVPHAARLEVLAVQRHVPETVSVLPLDADRADEPHEAGERATASATAASAADGEVTR